jgi:serine/threonine protein kinase
MRHLHHLGIVHRDLKLDNILYGPNGPEIADLGWSKTARPGDPPTGQRGTVLYMAPEILNGKEGCAFSADVYSYGICLWELFYSKLWFYQVNHLSAIDFPLAVIRGLRPSDPSHSGTLSDLFEHCFGANVPQAKRYTFDRIVRMIEETAENPQLSIFPHAHYESFSTYKKHLDQEVIQPMDENLMYLLRQLTDLLAMAGEIEALPIDSPPVEGILFCLGRLFGHENRQNEDVILIARHQFATKRCLDGSAFLTELEAFENFPRDRCKFPLADFLIDPDRPLDSNQTLREIEISNRNDLFRELRNILAGLCCSHPCVLKIHRWNIRNIEGKWLMSIVTDKAHEFSIDACQCPLDQSKFLFSLAIGMLELHSRGVLHHNLSDRGSILIRNGRAQICRFGLLDEAASFYGDKQACDWLFGQAQDPISRLQRQDGSSVISIPFHEYLKEILTQEHDPRPLSDVYQAIKNEVGTSNFPFDLFYLLVHPANSRLWQSQDEVLDVASGLASLTRGLNPEGIAHFKSIVNKRASAQAFLTPDLFRAL